MPEPRLFVLFDEGKYIGWRSLSIRRSIESAVGVCTVTGVKGSKILGKPGDRLRVQYGGENILVGFIDKRKVTVSEGGTSLSYSGRDRTADLVDSSFRDWPAEWFEASLLQIARDLALPLGIRVLDDAQADEPFPVFAFNPGEKGFEAIERACRLRGVLVETTPEGHLRLFRPEHQRAEGRLVEGENVLSFNLEEDHSERFSRYTVLAQSQTSDFLEPADSLSIEESATDPAIRDRRSTVIIAEGGVDTQTARARAQWEAAVRAARSSSVNVGVQGWSQVGSGRPWRAGEIVHADLPSIAFKGDLLVTAVELSFGESTGATAALELSRPDAFVPQPAVDQDLDIKIGLEGLL